MSLSAALSSATSSLRAIQTQLSVASNNIANADDVNYTKKTASQTERVAGGVGTGVEITSVSSSVDSYLVHSIVDYTSTNAAAQTFLTYVQSLSDSLGTLSSDSDSSGNTLATYLSSIESSLDELATTPESETLKNQTVTDIDDAVGTLRDASDEVQSLRANADSAIADAVDTVNDALEEVDSLNDAIVRAQAAGSSTADLEDQRNAALQTIAGQIDISYYTDSTGATHIYTGSGQVLLGDQVHELSYTAATSVDENSTYPGSLSGITVNGQDITSSIKSGDIAALVELRDTTLPGVQSQLDSLATSLADTINNIANQGSASPPPNTLTGSESYSSSDTFSGSGTLRVAVTDSSGNVVSTDDLDLSSYSTVGDLLTALNTISGLSASLDSSGHLVLSASSSSNGVAVAGGTVGSENFSGYFGLNDVLVGDTAGSISVKSDLAADTSRFPTGTMSTSGTLATGDKAVTSGSSTLATSMADAMRTADLSSAAGDIVTAVGTTLTSAKSQASSTETSLSTLTDRFSSNYGVNVDEETATITELQNSYAASAQVLSAVKAMFDDLLNAVS